MLKSARGETGGLDAHLFAVAVQALDPDCLITLHLANPARFAQAALVADLGPRGLHDSRIDQPPDLVFVALHDTNAQRHADLVRRQAGARSVQHRLGKIVEQLLDRRVDARNFPRLFAKHGLIEVQDGSDGHGRVLPSEGLSYASQRELRITNLPSSSS